MSTQSTPVSFARFQRWVVVAIVGCIFLYVGFSIWSGLDEINAELSKFNWWMFVVCCITDTHQLYAYALSNGITYWDDWMSRCHGASMHGILPPDCPWLYHQEKAGELLKPYVVKKITNVRMSRTTAALVTERLTDAIAMLLLAGLGLPLTQLIKSNTLSF